MTKKLYLENSTLMQFKANIVGRNNIEGHPAVELDQTAFYPRSGGQQHDTGTLDGVGVVKVLLQEDKIWHLLSKPINSKGIVTGKINWQRRFDFMQQHTAFHILAATFMRKAAAETLSSHLGEESSTIDLDTSKLDDELLIRVESVANRIVWENRPVSVRWPDRSELDHLPLRQPSEQHDHIRLIDIRDYDLDPCGGTHVGHTGQVGVIKFTGQERMRGKLRLYFVAGGRALRHYQNCYSTLKSCSEQLTTGVEELGNNIAKLLKDNKDLNKALSFMQEQVLQQTQKSLLQQSREREIVAARVGDIDLRKLCSRLITTNPDTLFLIIKSAKSRIKFCFCSNRENVDFKPVLELFQSEMSAKGGGRPNFIQGSAPAQNEVDSLLQKAADLMKSKLS